MPFKILNTLLEHGYTTDTKIRSDFDKATTTFGDLETAAIQAANVIGYDNSVSAVLKYQAENHARRASKAPTDLTPQ